MRLTVGARKMVKITFKPLKEIIIHENIEHKVRDLVRLRVLGLRKDSVALPLVWAEGVVFSRTMIPPIEDVVKDQLEGIIHFQAVEWALMSKYKKALKSEGVTVPVINVSENSSLRDVAKALKRPRKKT